jgi:hypothetical protein
VFIDVHALLFFVRLLFIVFLSPFQPSLCSGLSRIAAHPITRIAELLPHKWAPVQP